MGNSYSEVKYLWKHEGATPNFYSGIFMHECLHAHIHVCKHEYVHTHKQTHKLMLDGLGVALNNDCLAKVVVQD